MKRYDEKLIAERLYMYRQEVNHMSLNELSRISGVSSAHIGDIERGRNSPSNIEILCHLAKALDIRLDDILIDCLKYYDDSDKCSKDEIENNLNAFTVDELVKIDKMCDIILSQRKK